MLSNKNGSALVIALLVTLVLMTMGIAIIMKTNFELRHASVDVANQQVFYAAKSAANYGVTKASVMADNRMIGDVDTTLVLAMPAGTLDDYTFYQDSTWTSEGIQATVTQTDTVSADSKSQFNGLTAFVRPIEVRGRAKGIRGERAMVTQTFEIQQFPVFTFASLYGGDMKINAPLTLGGRLHANGNIYMDPSSSSEPIRLFNPGGDGTVLTAAGRFYEGEYSGNGNAYLGRVDGDTSAVVSSTDDWLQVNQGDWWPTVRPASDPTLDYTSTAIHMYEDLVQDMAHGIRPVQLPLDDNYDLIDEGTTADGELTRGARIFWQSTMRIETVPRDEYYMPDTTKVWIPIRSEYAANADSTVWYYLMHDEAFQEEATWISKEAGADTVLSSVWRSPNHIMNEWTLNLSDDAERRSKAKITVCHSPPGTRGKAHEINIGAAGARAHLAHGCYLGPCCEVCTGTGTPVVSGLPTGENDNDYDPPFFSNVAHDGVAEGARTNVANDTLKVEVGITTTPFNYINHKSNDNFINTHNNASIRLSGWNAAAYNADPLTGIPITSDDLDGGNVAYHVVNLEYEVSNNNWQVVDTIVIKVSPSPDGDDGGGGSGPGGAEVVKEYCSDQHAVDVLGAEMGWNNPGQVPADIGEGIDDDGDGLVDCEDPDCFGYGDWSGNTWDPVCDYIPGFASFYDDREDNWVAMTSLNLKNFLADTLMAEFDRVANNNYLPSGIEIPANLRFDDRTAIYVQTPTEVVMDQVVDWQADTLATQPWTTTGPCLDCDSGEYEEQFLVCLPCGPSDEPTTMILTGATLEEALDGVTNQECQGANQLTVADVQNGPCDQKDMVLIPVADVLRDPPPGYDSYSFWITDRRAEDTDFNSTTMFPDSTKANFANGVDYPSTVARANNFIPGVRIHNADSLRTWMETYMPADRANYGLTIASNVPIYVQGPYNTDGSRVERRVRSAFMSDGLTVLSSSWSDSISNQAYTARAATATSYNFALLGGQLPNDLGGLARLVGYLEDWGGVNHTWRTSLVNLFDSEVRSTPFVPNTWSADPNRKWTFDSRFLEPRSLPPATPRVSINQIMDWQYDRADEAW